MLLTVTRPVDACLAYIVEINCSEDGRRKPSIVTHKLPEVEVSECLRVSQSVSECQACILLVLTWALSYYMFFFSSSIYMKLSCKQHLLLHSSVRHLKDGIRVEV